MAERLFRLLLRLYPRAFRIRYGREIVEFLRDERMHPRYRTPVLGNSRFWVKTAWESGITALRLRSAARSAKPGEAASNEAKRLRPMETLLQDAKYALRGMRRQPSFALIVVATLALGIGANTAIFSVINGVVLQQLPYIDPEGLVYVWEQNFTRDVETNVVSPANYFAWKEQNEVFSEMGTISQTSATITGDHGPERIGMVYLSPSIFEMLGTRAALGRLLTASDVDPASPRVGVLSYGFWQRRFGSDPDVIGRIVTLNGQACEIVGVLPRDFDFDVPITFNSTGTRDIWIPVQFDEAARTARGRWLQVLARLDDGVTVERAQAHMATLASRLEQEYPEYQSGWGVRIVPLHTQTVGDVRTPLFVLLGSVGFVLLIACANVANLLLARATGRQREIAVRFALGAERSRVVRQLLTESTIVALAGGIVGLFLAYFALQALMALSPTNLPRLDNIRLDYAVVVFTAAISLFTGLLFGSLPALRISKLQPKDGLVEGGERAGTGLKHSRARSSLVVVEFALSMVLLIGAGLLMRSFASLMSVDVGFPTEDVITAQIGLPQSEYADANQRIRFFEDLVQRIQAIPGVENASAITFMPLAGTGSATSFWVNDQPIPPDGELPVADIRWVHRDFHEALGVPLLAGRFFDSQDTRDSPLKVIVNQTAAREFWPDQNAVGKTISMPWGDTLVAEIIGVVGDVRHNGPSSELRAKLYWDHRQFNAFPQMTVFARSSGSLAGITNSIRSTVAELDPALPIYNTRTLQSYYSEMLAQDRFTMLALGLFALLALVLASIGIYGVMSYSVNEKTREIGIKIALGAAGSAVIRQILVRAAALVATSIVLGLSGTLVLSRLMRGMVHGVSTSDPVTIAGVTGLLVAVALAACYLPARRASKIDPIEALRQE